MKRIQLLALTALLAGSIPATAFAGNPCGGSRIWLSEIYSTVWSLTANSTYIFETANLVSANAGFNADTVLHVQDFNGNFIAGNDDYNGLASRVVYTPTTSQNVRIIVRPYSDNNAGTGTFNVWQDGNLLSSFSIRFAGSTMDLSVLGMVAGTDIMTVEQFDGPRDTVVLVNSGGAYHAIAFDDDNGLDLQSYIHLTSACPAGDCKVIIGRYFNGTGTAGDGWGEVLIDGDVHNGLDSDRDGLGNCLEAFLGTNPSLADSDNDGLSDSAEVIGVDSTTLPNKLPLWGASPLFPDLFLEVDWTACDVVNDPSCGGNADLYRMTGADAATVANYFAPDFMVHLDIGVSNPATVSTQWTQWGNWGGATQTSAFTTWCDTLDPTRKNVFHHFHVTSAASGGGGQTYAVPSACSYGSSHRRTVAHELGHQIGLFHEGNTGTGRVNSKPNYPSMMNYGYAYDDTVTFSRNTQPSLSPTALAETNSPLSSLVLTSLAKNSWLLNTDPASGKVDWNRDGQFDSQVRGSPTWIGDGGSLAPETTEPWHDFSITDRQTPAFARSSASNRLYLFSTRDPDFKIQYRYTSSFAACSGGDASSPCVTWTGPTVISNSKAGSATTGGPASYRVTVSGKEKMMVVYPDTSGAVWYQLGDSAGNWSTPKTTVTTASSFKVALAPAGAAAGGKLRLYYKNMSTGALNSTDYDPTTDKWSSAAVEYDDSNNTIRVNFGLSVVRGVEPSNSGAYYMAMVNASNTIDLWRYNSSTSRWTKLPNIWVTTQPATVGAPSLAYVPFSSSTSRNGQFYLSYPEKGGYKSSRIMKTEGNDTSTGATSRRLQFREAPMYFFNYWGTANGSPAIFYEMGFDTNLRGAFPTINTTTGSCQISFFPVADGIPDITLKDQDDYYYMKNTLSCSMGQGGCIPL
jgi:hypothetical protein